MLVEVELCGYSQSEENREGPRIHRKGRVKFFSKTVREELGGAN